VLQARLITCPGSRIGIVNLGSVDLLKSLHRADGAEFVAVAEALRKKSRNHDLVIADVDQQSLYLAVTGNDREILTNAVCRFKDILTEPHRFHERGAAFFPQDGNTFAALVEALHKKLSRSRKDPSGGPT